ncbi:hypothetical protein GQ44DRAFT_744244 [Phaeosphaeriaceae sp. PMI808]|nr:hypothetical protein GQ44DRAFT_744244 [Phaeosphaeriaceae sp. PMI808]
MSFGPGYTQLSPIAFYRIPPQLARPSGRCIASEPHLILVTSWLDAAPKHVAKYLAGIQKIFPTSRILLVMTNAFHFLFQPTTQRLRELQPAVDILKDTQPHEKILLYSFSNGGSTAAFMIARAFRAQTNCPLPISKAIFDSSPGNGGYVATVRAFAVGLPRARFVRGLGMAVLRVFLALWYLVETITATENIIDIMRRGLNDRLLFTTQAARLYIYSMNDQMVPWSDVEAHASNASSIGYKVQTVRYVGSSHCGHIMQDEARYWAAVEQLWNSDYLSAPGLVTVAW